MTRLFALSLFSLLVVALGCGGPANGPAAGPGAGPTGGAPTANDAEIAKRIVTPPEGVKLVPLEFKCGKVELIIDVPEGTKVKAEGNDGTMLEKDENFSIFVGTDGTFGNPTRMRRLAKQEMKDLLVDKGDLVVATGDFTGTPYYNFGVGKELGMHQYFICSGLMLDLKFGQMGEEHARLGIHCAGTLRRKSPVPTELDALVAEHAFIERKGDDGTYEFLHLNNTTSAAVLAILPQTPKLKSLKLTGGSVDDKVMPEVAKLADLEFLILEATSITDAGLMQLAPLRKLTRLDIETSIFGTPSAMHGSGLTALKDCPLQELSLLAGPIAPEGWAAIGAFTKLKELKAPLVETGEANFDDDAAKKIAGLVELERLDVRYGDLTDAGLDAIAKFTKLKSLSLGKTKITDAGLAKLKDLKELDYLDVSETAVGDASVPLISTFTKLTYLDSNRSQLTPDGLAKIQAAIPKLKK